MADSLNKQDARTSGLPLLAVYVVLAVCAFGGAVGAMYVAEQMMGSAAGILFVVFIVTALIAPWPVAVWLTEPRRAMAMQRIEQRG